MTTNLETIIRKALEVNKQQVNNVQLIPGSLVRRGNKVTAAVMAERRTEGLDRLLSDIKKAVQVISGTVVELRLYVWQSYKEPEVAPTTSPYKCPNCDYHASDDRLLSDHTRLCE